MAHIKRVLDHDPEMGVTEYFHYDTNTDRTTIEVVQDVEPILEANKAQYAQQRRGDRHGDLSKIASLPLVVLTDLRRRGILQDKKRMKKWLMDPENRFFLTRPVQL